MSIQGYISVLKTDPSDGEVYASIGKYPHGYICMYKDHLAAIAEKDKEISRLREAAKLGANWMKWWLDNSECECEGAHVCGHSERENELKAINEALKESDDD